MKKKEENFGWLISRHKSVVVVDLLWGNQEEATESSVRDITTFSASPDLCIRVKTPQSRVKTFFANLMIFLKRSHVSVTLFRRDAPHYV